MADVTFRESDILNTIPSVWTIQSNRSRETSNPVTVLMVKSGYNNHPHTKPAKQTCPVWLWEAYVNTLGKDDISLSEKKTCLIVCSDHILTVYIWLVNLCCVRDLKTYLTADTNVFWHCFISKTLVLEHPPPFFLIAGRPHWWTTRLDMLASIPCCEVILPCEILSWKRALCV